MTLYAKRVMALAVAVCATVLAGCGGDPASPQPGALSDPAGLSNDVQSLDIPLQAAVFQSFSAIGSSPLSARTASFLAAMAPAPKRTLPATREAATRKQAFAVKSLHPSFASAPTGPGSLIPETEWGKVFVWDAGTDAYVEGAATGGPANGVQFTLYELDDATRQPKVPLNPIGHADLTDESTDTKYRLGVLVADQTTTYADYLVSATASASDFQAVATGFVTDGTHRLDFSNSASASSTHISIDFDLTLNQPDVTAHLHADLVAGDPTTVLTLAFSVTRGGEAVALSGTLGITSSQSGASATANLVIAVNQRQFATITGTVTSGSPTGYKFTGPERALTVAERSAVDQLMTAPAVLAAAAEPVFAPAEQLVGSTYSLGF